MIRSDDVETARKMIFSHVTNEYPEIDFHFQDLLRDDVVAEECKKRGTPQTLFIGMDAVLLEFFQANTKVIQRIFQQSNVEAEFLSAQILMGEEPGLEIDQKDFQQKLHSLISSVNFREGSKKFLEHLKLQKIDFFLLTDLQESTLEKFLGAENYAAKFLSGCKERIISRKSAAFKKKMGSVDFKRTILIDYNIKTLKEMKEKGGVVLSCFSSPELSHKETLSDISLGFFHSLSEIVPQILNIPAYPPFSK